MANDGVTVSCGSNCGRDLRLLSVLALTCKQSSLKTFAARSFFKNPASINPLEPTSFKLELNKISSVRYPWRFALKTFGPTLHNSLALLVKSLELSAVARWSTVWHVGHCNARDHSVSLCWFLALLSVVFVTWYGFKVIYAAAGRKRVKLNEDLGVLAMFPFPHFCSNETVDKCVPSHVGSYLN